MDFNRYHSKLDTERFGFNIAKINEFNYPIFDMLKSLKSGGYNLIISKVNANNIKLINELEQHGFEIKDIQVTYKFTLPNHSPFTPAVNAKIRNAELSDRNVLFDIAKKSFKDYGHYSADKRLDSEKCNEIYSDWIVRSFDKQVADNILIAEIDGRVAGFLSHKIYQSDNKYAAGGIGAVDPDYRNKNVFQEITIAGINWARENNCEWVEHNVLITNYPVNRSFSGLGFKISNSFVTFHKWLSE